MSGSQRSQSARRNKKGMAGWEEEQPQHRVARGWMVRKVNSGKAKRASFAQGKQFAGPSGEAGRN
jgi:hypothetical protein